MLQVHMPTSVMPLESTQRAEIPEVRMQIAATPEGHMQTLPTRPLPGQVAQPAPQSSEGPVLRVGPAQLTKPQLCSRSQAAVHPQAADGLSAHSTRFALLAAAALEARMVHA